ncbi:MAG: dipeptidase [Anaerolineales bacterium]|jgi:membrane dipeptidase|nr:dipeptidase [Anaerolineales bacterium]
MHVLVDAHQDLAWNALTFGRDYSLTTAEIRQEEAGGQVPEINGDTLLGWDAYQRGQVALIFATLFAAPLRAQSHPELPQYYANPDQAYTLYRRQADHYLRLFEQHPDKFQPITSRAQLSNLMEQRRKAASPPASTNSQPLPVGLVLLMEGAEAIRQPSELEEWWQLGLRILGPAWLGNRFCGGTHEPGPLTREGRRLLEGMAEYGFNLDVSHMDAQAALQALDIYPGPVLASHANAQALLKDEAGNRHLPDEVIRGLIERGGVIGIVPTNPFLLSGWKRGQPRRLVPLERVAAHIDYICQLAGSPHHVGLGTDFDGGFGVQEVPEGVDTIADLQRLAPLLAEKGYSQADIDLIFGGNWLSHLERTLPEAS